MPESFGVRLRQRRERQHITLTKVAEQTKIKRSLLEELERDDVSHWPAGIFRRAFIRAYADAIGLEPDVVVREFLELYPDPIEVVEMVPAGAVPAEGGSAGVGPPIRLRYLVRSAIDSLSRLSLGTAQKQAPPVDEAAAASTTPARALAFTDPDLVAAARVCTELGRLDDARDAASLLQEAARILDAVGLIVWAWDPRAAELTPALACGYSDKVLAQLPRVSRDADNATASAFRSAYACVVEGRDGASGALAVPLMAASGCVGVLAIELQHGSEQRDVVHAVVTIFAAQLARLVGTERAEEAADRRLA